MYPTVLHSPGPHESTVPNSDAKFEREHGVNYSEFPITAESMARSKERKDYMKVNESNANIELLN